jgi:hypothetical protein
VGEGKKEQARKGLARGGKEARGEIKRVLDPASAEGTGWGHTQVLGLVWVWDYP